jgi:hypothetical protein
MERGCAFDQQKGGRQRRSWVFGYGGIPVTKTVLNEWRQTRNAQDEMK